jgi:thiol-disulfide isomerase/thioredoxin/nitrate reductase NapE component
MSTHRLLKAALRLLEKQSHYDTTTATLNLVKSLDIPVTASTVIETLEQHPYFPSLLSISESLTKWNVDNIALRVKPETLEELPTPFIAHKKKPGFVLVNSVNGKVEYTDEKGRTQIKSKEEFAKLWDNVVLLAEPTTRSGDQFYPGNRRKEIIHFLRIPFILFLCVALIVSFAYVVLPVHLFSIPLLLIKFTGSIVAGLLLWFELDKANPLLKQICTVGKNTNCTAVLGSKAARLFNVLSWSEIGFFYFTGGFLFLLMNVGNAGLAFGWLSWVNLLALPYPFFSVFYQWRIAKQWCPLCLVIQGLLILEFVTSYAGYWSSFQWPVLATGTLIVFFTAFLLPVFFWLSSKSALLKAQHVNQYKKDLGRMAYNKEILDTLLTKQKAITAPADGLGITLGDPDAPNTIIKVCNPYCGPCAKAHPAVDELLEHNPHVKVQIIFSVIVNDETSKSNKVAKHLMALYEKKDADLIKQALDDWYVNLKHNYDAFAAKYPLEETLKKQELKLLAMREWCAATEIEYTPTFFVNGYQLPDVYKIENLKHIL